VTVGQKCESAKCKSPHLLSECVGLSIHSGGKLFGCGWDEAAD